jgi:hypothetical protein
VLLPYSVTSFEHCFKVVGIDAAFLDPLSVKGNQKRNLKEIFPELPDAVNIQFQQCFVIAVTGRTNNNEMILLALSICHSESKVNYKDLLKFLKDNGV